MNHDHYFRDVSALKRVDVYRLLRLFGVTCPVAQHVFKKALAAGQRGHKSLRKDWQDIADSAARRLQMMDEDEQPKDPRTVVGVDASFDTERHMNFAPLTQRHCADCSAEHCPCVAR